MADGQERPRAGDVGAASAAFDLLDEKVRRWIWKQSWDELRDIQEKSIPRLLDGSRDLVIMAGTASGKTEAAFLPIVSRLAGDAPSAGAGFGALYVSPLRALINDQFERMQGLCDEVGIPVAKWHGDVAASSKARARKHPQGIVLLTPESLEAILVRHGPEAPRLFASLRYLVVDEMHAFLDEPRGKQLQSLLHRVETAARHRVARVGLSATLSGEAVAKAFLRPLDPSAVDVLHSEKKSQGILLAVRGYVEATKPKEPEPTDEGENADETFESPAEAAIVRHLFSTLRGTRSLVFAGARRRVEAVTVGLSGLTEARGVPEEFFAHHGSLSREFREEAERRMKDSTRPASIVCTTTLELGIDVGHIEAVAQLGPGHTISGMRQRLGRSGRRPGQSSVMRVYTKERELDERTHPLDALRRDTVQSIAMVRLMLEGWNEPPTEGRLHLSTLLHQVLALVAQHGGLTAQQGWHRLVKSGVFGEVSLDLYKTVLRRMADPKVGLIEQAPDGTLLPGPEGERIMAGRYIYAVFKAPEEYRVITERGRALGSLPAETLYVPDQLIVLGGRRWRVVEVDPKRHEMVVAPARGGQPPLFGGDPVPPSERVLLEMVDVWQEADIPSYLDATAGELLVEGRKTFERLGLRTGCACRHEGTVLLFPWVGPRTQNALLLSLATYGLEPVSFGVAIGVPGEHANRLRRTLVAIANEPPQDGVDLARRVPDKRQDKFDGYFDDDLLALTYASSSIDAGRVPQLARTLAARLPQEFLEGWA